MKVLIAAPIHEIKDYAIPRWIKSVSRIKTKCDWKLLMVDNSENQQYYKKIDKYCQDIGFTNYELSHILNTKDGDTFEPERLGFSRELIRRKMLEENYDRWLSWECDIICPPEILDYLLRFTPEFEAIYHTYPPRGHNPMAGGNIDYQEQDGMGCVLYDRRIFYNFKFSENKVPLGADGRLLFEVMRRGWKILEIHNVFHLEHLMQ